MTDTQIVVAFILAADLAIVAAIMFGAWKVITTRW